ncbi:MAG: peroxidase family protein [Verrucomicrobiota bacterium]
MNKNSIKIILLSVGVSLLVSSNASAQRQGDQRDRSSRDRSGSSREQSRPSQEGNLGTAVFPEEYRSIDGTGNNIEEPIWGSAQDAFLRLFDEDYADGIEAPSGGDRPSPRAISNAVVAQDGDTPNSANATDYLWQWGQFLDHDITETPIVDPLEPLNIAVPAGDPWFDPFNTGAVEIALNRSFYVYDNDGVRQQVNQITAFIDASNVYGSDHERAEDLRANDGSGRLRVSEGDYLPYNINELENAPSHDPNFYIAGDFRANEQVGLIAMHTLFVREHNYWADRFRSQNPDADGDTIYEMARAVVAAEMQVITYREFLPIVIGRNAIPRYEGYDPSVDPGIANAFATAAYRFGHTMLSTELLRIDENGNTIAEGNLSLADAFFNPDEFAVAGMEPILRGLGAQVAQEIDPMLIDDVRNFLFGPPGAGGFDLASLNVQRGRDHGLPSYNDAREALGLGRVADFSEVSSDPVTAANLASVYASVDDIDLWIGGLSEDKVDGALVGETWQAILADQFQRLRDGDRFWYEGYLPPAWVDMVEDQTLSRIVRRNTEIGPELSDNVFVIEPERDRRDRDRNRDGRRERR